MASTLPRVRQGVHGQVLGDEVLILDESGQTAHVLKGEVAGAWRAVASQQAEQPPVSVTGLAVLEELGLVEWAPGASRRDFLRHAGTVAIGASVITIGLPSVAAAHSGGGHVPGAFTLSPATQTFSSTSTGSLTATVAGLAGHPTPTGTVSVYRVVGGVKAATPTAAGTLNSSGIATITLLGTTQSGTYVGVYSGDLRYVSGPDSNSVTVTVTTPAPPTPTVTLGSHDTQKNKSYSLTVTVSGNNGTPSGTVSLTLAGATADSTSKPLPTGSSSVSFTITNPKDAGQAVSITAQFTSNNSSYGPGTSAPKTYTTTNP